MRERPGLRWERAERDLVRAGGWVVRRVRGEERLHFGGGSGRVAETVVRGPGRGVTTRGAGTGLETSRDRWCDGWVDVCDREGGRARVPTG